MHECLRPWDNISFRPTNRAFKFKVLLIILRELHWSLASKSVLLVWDVVTQFIDCLLGTKQIWRHCRRLYLRVELWTYTKIAIWWCQDSFASDLTTEKHFLIEKQLEERKKPLCGMPTYIMICLITNKHKMYRYIRYLRILWPHQM